jgi:hypothetical protein
MGFYSHQEAETGLLTGPSGLQPVCKAHGLHVDKTVEIWVTKVESAFGGYDEGEETELLSNVLRDLSVGEGILQHSWCVVRSFEILS